MPDVTSNVEKDEMLSMENAFWISRWIMNDELKRPLTASYVGRVIISDFHKWESPITFIYVLLWFEH